MYYLEKMGVYGHGIFWIGENIEEGKRMADKAARNDRDDYHDWELRKFVRPNEATDFSMDAKDNGHEIVYIGVRTLLANALDKRHP